MARLPNGGRATTHTGGPFNAFASLKKPVPRKVNTGVYVFAINPANNQVHWAFGRKVPPNRRVPRGWLKTPPGQSFVAALRRGGRAVLPQLLKQYNPPLAGAAGTDEIYHGKWVSLGGGSAGSAQHLLDAARIELNDEAAVRPRLEMDEIFLPNSGRPFVKGKSRATLVGSDQVAPSTYIFVFRWENFQDFMDHFPPVENKTLTRGGPFMASASHGEIDFAQSFTPTQVVAFWNQTQAASQQNFFTSYTMMSFQKNVMNIMKTYSDFLVKKRGKPPLFLNEVPIRSISVSPDTAPRRPNGWRDQFMPYVA